MSYAITAPVSVQRSKESGFTLVELSIVLVIIGLIVSGVLVGQDLITAARERALATQVSQYEVLATVFYDKFSGRFPGDSGQACGGLAAGVCAPGDNDGLIEGGAAANNLGEIGSVWVQLETAGMSQGEDYTIAPTDATSYDNILYAPTSRLGKGRIVYVGDADAALGNVAYVGIAGNLKTENGVILTAIEAQALDSKLDDGLANDGRLIPATIDESTAGGDTFTADLAACATGAVYSIEDAGNICNAFYRIAIN